MCRRSKTLVGMKVHVRGPRHVRCGAHRGLCTASDHTQAVEAVEDLPSLKVEEGAGRQFHQQDAEGDSRQ